MPEDNERRVEELREHIRRQNHRIAGHSRQLWRDRSAWDAKRREHERKAELLGSTRVFASIFEDLRFDAEVLAEDLRRFFANSH